MNKSDVQTLELIKKLINEVKTELGNKKVLSEGKTPQDVFKNHEKNMKEYIANNVWETIKNSQK